MLVIPLLRRLRQEEGKLERKGGTELERKRNETQEVDLGILQL
jgi:hypothetical protein